MYNIRKSAKSLSSALIRNEEFFCLFFIVSHTKCKKLYVISTLKRPVPLKHFLYTGNSKQTSDQLFEIVGEENKFITKGYIAYFRQCLKYHRVG